MRLRKSKPYLLASAVLVTWACAKANDPVPDSQSFQPNGGTSGSGGSAAQGASGGSGGQPGTGGSSAQGGSGGTLAQGGSGGGGATAGMPAAGGKGGSVASGGVGGSVATGGGKAAGGSTSVAGGSATGGATATGGVSSVGGSGGNATAGTSTMGGAGGAGGKAMGMAGVPNDPNWKPPDMTATASLIVLYQAQQKDAMTYSIGMMLQLKNQTSAAYSLSKVTIRYWFSSEAAPTPRFDYTASGLSAAAAPTFVANMSNSYIEMSFKAGGTVPVYVDQNSLNNTNMSVAVQAQSNTGQFNETNDWSFDGTASAYKPNPKITVYDNGTLIWGCEPSHLCATPDVGAGGQSGT